jgi:ATP-binding cassette subfamily F protein uup
MDNVVTSTWVFDTDTEGKGVVNEYVGGYQEYLVQKTREQAARAARTTNNSTKNDKPTTKSAPTPKPNKVTKKLNFNEQRELDNLPKEISALEAEQTQLQEKLADGSWFTQDFDAATAASERLLMIEDEMMVKLERWNTLEG